MSVKTMSFNIEGLFSPPKTLNYYYCSLHKSLCLCFTCHGFGPIVQIFFVTTCNDFCLQILSSSCHQRFINLENFLIFAFSKQTYWIFLATSDLLIALTQLEKWMKTWTTATKLFNLWQAVTSRGVSRIFFNGVAGGMAKKSVRWGGTGAVLLTFSKCRKSSTNI